MFLKTRKLFICLLSTVLSISLYTNVAFAQDLEAGKKVFESTCTACHKLGEQLIGPDLTGVNSRWKDEQKLIAFVKNSQAVINSGDAYAKALYAKFNVLMPPQDLTDQQVKDVLAYANAGKSGGAPAADAGGAAAPGGQQGGGANTALTAGGGMFGMSYEATAILLIVLFFILLIIAYTLWRVRTQLRRMGVTAEDDTTAHAAPAHEGWFRKNWNFYRKYTNPTFVILTIVGLLVLLWIVDLYDRTQDLGTQINYAPEQPIKFNHKLHAGQYGIQCQYCHTGVEKGKQANIPSLSTCMNCHNYIKEGPQYGKTEIAKITEAYNSKTPVRWVRIHNLPDHVYFNHSQHVVAGKVQCQSCHGAVQEMDRVQQVSTLEMGWCINCHRETGVDKENPYYTSTFDFIKKHKKYSIAQLGGTECSKCHY